MKSLLSILGLDTAKEKYAYAEDPFAGHVSAQRLADTWVKTTCGYCSVGCGMLVGIKDGSAVAARGNPDHPVNRGKLCPKGLSEHYAISTRRAAPLTRCYARNGTLEPVSWDEALRHHGRANCFESSNATDARRLASSAPANCLPRSSTRWASWCNSAWARGNFDGNTTLCMSTAVSGYKRSFGSDGPPGCYEDFGQPMSFS